jgi:hypothetical protein
MLAPPVVSLPLLRWVRGPLSVPYRQGTPTYRLESKTRKTYYHMPYNTGSCLPAREGSSAATSLVAPNPASLLVRALTLPRVPRLRILHPYSGGLRRCHVSCSSGSRLPTREGFGAATCPTALNPASLLGRAPALPRDLWFSVGRRPQE